MAGLPGYKGKVTIGADTVNEIADWAISGMTNDFIEDTELTDTFKSFVHGEGQGGTVSIKGFYDDDDAAGQDIIIAAFIAKTSIDEVLLYFGSGDADFWMLNLGATCHVEGLEIGAAVNGIVPVSYVLKVSGGYFDLPTANAKRNDLTFADADPDTIVSAALDLAAAGFAAGQVLQVLGSNLNDDRYEIASVTTVTITLVATDTLTAESGTTGVKLSALTTG